MKNIKSVFYFAALSGMVFLNSCKDDSTPTDPVGGAKTCTLKTTSDQDGDKVHYTFDNGKLVKVVEEFQSGSDTYDYIYTSGQLTEIREGSDSYKITYTAGKVSRVDYYSGTDIEDVYKVTFGGNGKLSKVDVYYVDGTDEILYDSYVYTFSGDNLSSMVNSFDTDDDGVLDTDMTTTISGHDTKINPYYQLPIYLVEFDNPLYLSKNNPTGGSIKVLSDNTTFTITYTYDSNNLPTTMVSMFGGSSFSQNNTYDCK